MIYVNSNLEILTNLIDGEDIAAREEQAEDLVGQLSTICAVVEDQGLEWQASPSFRDWQGGKHTQFHQNLAGLVAYSTTKEAAAAQTICDAVQAFLAQPHV